MRYKLLSFFVFWAVLLHGECILTGEIINPSSRVFRINIHNATLGVPSKSYTIRLDEENRFHFKTPVASRAEFTLRSGRISFPIYLESSDSIHLKITKNKDSYAVNFSGDKVVENRFYFDFWKETYKPQRRKDDLIRNSKAQAYWALIMQQSFKRKKFLRIFLEQNPNALSLDFQEWVDAETNYLEASDIMIYLLYHKLFLENDQLEDFFKQYLKNINVSSKPKQISPSYYKFLITILNYKLVPSIKTKEELSDNEKLDFLVRQYNFVDKALKGTPKYYLQYDLLQQMLLLDHQYAKIEYLDFINSSADERLRSNIELLHQLNSDDMNGRQVANLSLIDEDGETFRFGELSPKASYLNFWQNTNGLGWLNPIDMRETYILQKKFRDQPGIRFGYIYIGAAYQYVGKNYFRYDLEESPISQFFQLNLDDPFTYFFHMTHLRQNYQARYVIVDKNGKLANDNAVPPGYINSATQIKKVIK